MEINVAQLLQSPIGTVRDYEVDEVAIIAGDKDGNLVRGEVRLVRTQRGILVSGVFHTEMELTCSRCLSTFHMPLMVKIEEEFLPTIDILSGLPLPPSDEPGAFMIDDHHVIDLAEAVRQYVLMAVPMKPLCEENCAGLCPQCGRNQFGQL